MEVKVNRRLPRVNSSGPFPIWVTTMGVAVLLAACGDDARTTHGEVTTIHDDATATHDESGDDSQREPPVVRISFNTSQPSEVSSLISDALVAVSRLRHDTEYRQMLENLGENPDELIAAHERRIERWQHHMREPQRVDSLIGLIEERIANTLLQNERNPDNDMQERIDKLEGVLEWLRIYANILDKSNNEAGS